MAISIKSNSDGTTGAIQVNGVDVVGINGSGLVSPTIASPTVSSPTLTGSVYNNGSVRSNITAVAALDINCSSGNFFTKTINGNSTFTFSNVPSSVAYGFILELTHTSGTVTWPTSVKWPGDVAPSLTTGKVHRFAFITDNGGTAWAGVAQVNYTA